MKCALVCNVTRLREEVFDFLSDIRNEKLWNPRLIEIEKVSSGPIGPGTTFRGRYRGLGELSTELIVCERASRSAAPIGSFVPRQDSYQKGTDTTCGFARFAGYVGRF